MTRFYIGHSELNKWIHQNKAEYSEYWQDGCLLDSFVVFTKRGMAAFYEHPLNEWCSDYYVEFQSGKEMEKTNIVMENWLNFERRIASDVL